MNYIILKKNVWKKKFDTSLTHYTIEDPTLHVTAVRTVLGGLGWVENTSRLLEGFRTRSIMQLRFVIYIIPFFLVSYVASGWGYAISCVRAQARSQVQTSGMGTGCCQLGSPGPP